MQKIVFTSLLLFLVSSCSAQGTNKYPDAKPIIIQRFDKDLFRLINTGSDAEQAFIRQTYPQMLDVFGKGVLNMQSPDMPGFFDKLINYFSEPTLKGLYADAIAQYDSIADIELELGKGFAYFTDQMPSLRQPTVYMHVSGLNQNVLTGDNQLSISIDKYLGSDFPLYRDFFYPQQRLKMQRSYVVSDYLTGWLMTEYPFTGKEFVLLERMVYEGKLKYILSQALPERSPAALLGMTEEAYEWCKKHEENIWKAMIERKHLYTPDRLTTTAYFDDMPSAFLSGEAPGNLGTYIGWQIIIRYMEETKSDPETLMKQTDAQEILTRSKYKPL